MVEKLNSGMGEWFVSEKDTKALGDYVLKDEMVLPHFVRHVILSL